MRNWSIFVGRLFGVEVRIHLTFLFLLAFVLFYEPNGGVVNPWRGLVLVLLILVSVALHEMAHVIAAWRAGVTVRGIMLLPIGGMIILDPQEHLESTRKPAREAGISAAGPLVSAALAFMSAVLIMALIRNPQLLARPLVTPQALVRSSFWINASLFALNLLPAFPLDGGRVLRSWLARRMDFQKATRRAVTIGHVFAATFMVTGAAGSSPWLMMIGFFIFMAAQLEERSMMFHSVVETVHMEDIMLTDFSTLSPADTLEDALDRAVHSLQDDFPVVREGDLVGVINRQTIVERLRQEGNGYVQGAMSKGFEIASRSESLASAFRKLTARGLTLIPVVDQDRLVGIVTLQNPMHSMGLLAESRRLRQQVEDRQAGEG